VQLLRDTTPVAGTVRFNSSTDIIGELLPTNLLSPQTAYRLTVAPQIRTLAGVALASPLSVVFTTGVAVQPQAGAQLVFTGQPSNATAGTVISPPVMVTIKDSLGRTLTSDTNVVVLTVKGPGFPGLGGTVGMKPVNGVATFSDLWIGQAATSFTLLANAEPLGTVVAATSAPFDIAPVAPDSLAFTGSGLNVAGIGGVLPVRQPFALDVAILDSFRNTVTTATNAVTISLGASPSGATLAGVRTVAAIQGVAHLTNLTVDQAGAYTLVATAATLSPAQSNWRAFASGTFIAVSAGSAHTCGITSTGTLYCWGSNSRGQLGDGTTTDRLIPVPVAGGLTFSSVSTGGNYTCGVTPAGNAYCWGLNDHGQLGDGTTSDRTSPVLVAGGLRFGAFFTGFPVLSAGASNTCGLVLNTSGEPFTYCWGLNDRGQLGDGTTNQRTSPTPVAAAGQNGLPPLQLDNVSAGGAYTCGLNYDTGWDYCWGANSNGQLDDGTTTDRASPVLIGGIFNPQITTGAAHTCAIQTVPVMGSESLTPLYCWGADGNGQLGDGATTDRAARGLVGGGLNFATVSAGGSHTCGVAGHGAWVRQQAGQWMAGDVYCWGLNSNGQLGDGTGTQRTSPVLVAGGLAFRAVSAGASHTCGVTDAGVYCWGSNSAGQLGTGTTTSSSVPIKVLGQP
jgi:alpha-tubulin suppressor-like RCC1 family protein